MNMPTLPGMKLFPKWGSASVAITPKCAQKPSVSMAQLEYKGWLRKSRDPSPEMIGMVPLCTLDRSEEN
jgi:hypothetical protein